MKKSLVKALAGVAALTFLSQPALGACDKTTIKGNFAGSATFYEDEDNWATVSSFMVYFNGRGGVQVKKIVEGYNGVYGVANGNGSYGLTANCTGTANLNIKQGGRVVARGRMDFSVGGTKANPEILGVYTNTSAGSSGEVRMVKSNL